MLCAYARFIVRHSYLVLFTVSAVATILTVIPLVCHNLPSFSDPTVGFETRGTTLAHRFVAWENLFEETRPSKRLAANPKEIEDQIRMNQTYNNTTRLDRTRSGHRRKKKGRNSRKKLNINDIGFENKWFNVSEVINTSTEHDHYGFGKNVSYQDKNEAIFKDHTRKQWISLKELQRNPNVPIHLNFMSNNCEPLISDYAHVVVSNTENTSLLTYDNIQRLCKWQSLLIELGEDEYSKMCQRTSSTETVCCPVWSVPNYMALISSKTSCENLTREDVNITVSLLSRCAPYFHNFTLKASCDLDVCSVPKYCSQFNAIHNMLFYLLDYEAFSPPTYTDSYVKNLVIFFPLPSSSTILPYYKKLQNSNLSYENLFIPAIEFGLKNALFDLWIFQDTWLIGLGGIFVFAAVWSYTKSLILTLLLFTAITYSLGVAYFLYIYVFNLEFFPFMNLLVIVVVLGIGADDAFLYMKVWNMVGQQLIRDNVVPQDNDLTDIKNMNSAGETILIQILKETMKHSIITMLITTLTTAVAFYASYVSYISAINCFSVFAGTAVVVNFFLMISWLPVSVFIVDVKLFKIKRQFLTLLHNSIKNTFNNVHVFINRFIISCVTKLHIVFVTVLGAIGIGSIIVVFYVPGLQLPDSRQFQLFKSSHPFEQYELYYRDRFLFERFAKNIGTGSRMPLRWVWGVKAIDNGNHMDPVSTGHLEFDEDFSVSEPSSQLWLAKFCSKIKAQKFYQHTLGSLIPNSCFMDTLMIFMSRRCIDKISKINRRPCCESSQFPYKKEVFDFCLMKAIESLYQTSPDMNNLAGPKFLRSSSPPKVAAIVVEFESVVPYSMSYTAMDKFFVHVENWTQEELKTAPAGLKGGWFVSDFQFYDLQKTLASGTVMALLLSAILGFIVLIPATQSFVVSVCALSAMIFSATVTIAILVLNEWKLNVLESVSISTSAGLAVDFSLHYALSYTNASGSKSSRVKSALTASAGPTAAAAITTGFAGIFLLHSHLLPYYQIGAFLALIMTVSWTYATFYLCPLLHIFGRNSIKDDVQEDRKSISRVSSVSSRVPNLESHELERLADSNRTNLTHSQSPSSISATTMVLHDDFENTSHTKLEKKTNITSNLDCDND